MLVPTLPECVPLPPSGLLASQRTRRATAASTTSQTKADDAFPDGAGAGGGVLSGSGWDDGFDAPDAAPAEADDGAEAC